MKKHIKFLSIPLVIITIFFVAYSCSKSQSPDQQKGNLNIKTDTTSADTTYLSANVAIVNVQLREVQTSKYVREITWIDFAKTKQMPSHMGTSNYTYSDDGSGYDTKSGDGVYTSTSLINSPDTTRMLENTDEDGDTTFYYVGHQFRHTTALEQYFSGGLKSLPGLTIGCKIGFIKCSEGGTCNACNWYDATCYYFYDCYLEISWSW